MKVLNFLEAEIRKSSARFVFGDKTLKIQKVDDNGVQISLKETETCKITSFKIFQRKQKTNDKII